MTTLTCILIDDEPPALKLLQELASRIDFLDIKGSFSSAENALKFLSENEVDCIFSDIEMPGLNGVEFTKIVNNFAKTPEIIFVTAYGKYAVDGFKVEATDFLLKPYSLDELKTAAQKALKKTELKNLETTREENSAFFLKVDARQVRFDPSTILFAESMRDYVKIYIEERDIPYIPLITLKKFRELLPEKNFLQINRSQIINLDKITSFGKNTVSIGDRNFSVTGSFREEFERRKENLG